MSKTGDIGVIVGRFQVHELHDGHRQLIDFVKSRHSKVMIFLGVSRVAMSSRNPLDFASRKAMIQTEYPDIIMQPLVDQALDEVWSEKLDTKIKETFPMGKPVLYGSRDSFLPYYKGKHDTHEMAQEFYLSGTEIRKQVSEEIKNTPEWRAGVIYATYNRFPISYQAVDIAIFDEKRTRLLLARKPNEKKYRFVGGFVDPKDTSLEIAAKRETSEEVGGAEIGDLEYVGSFRVNDWRYRSEVDKIMTTIFAAKYLWGPLEPSDDISELRWFDLADLATESAMIKNIVPEHHPLMAAVIAKYNTK